jgi:hypothetical protein
VPGLPGFSLATGGRMPAGPRAGWLTGWPGSSVRAWCSKDADSIRPGDDFAAEIEAAVGACAVLLAVIGP